MNTRSLEKILFFLRQRGNSGVAEKCVAVVDTASCHGGEDRQIGDVARFTGKGVSGLMYQIEAKWQGELEAHAQCDNGLDIGLRFVRAISILADSVLVDKAQASQSLVSQPELVHVVGKGRSELTGQLVHDGGGLPHVGLELWRVGGDVTDNLIECGILVGVLGCWFLPILHSYALSAWAGQRMQKSPERYSAPGPCSRKWMHRTKGAMCAFSSSKS